jgi:hypothetical protein
MMSKPSRASFRRTARIVSLALLALAAMLVAGACGGDDEANERDAEALLNRAFAKSMSSADLTVDAQLEIRGLEGLDSPIRLDASGPFQSGDGGLPKLDIDVRVGAQEAGQTVQTGFVSTGDRAFLKFGGEFYEQPRADIERANRQLQQSGARDQESALTQLGVKPREWVSGARMEGEEDVGGVKTQHVSAKVDVRRMLSDLNKAVERSGQAVGGVAPGTPKPLSDSQLDKLAAAVKEPTFDVYVGKDDDVIRRVSANLEVSIPEADRAGSGGIEGGSLRFSVEFADVNGDQTVEAPSKARPIADLAKQLGGLSALGGAGPDSGGQGGSEPESSQGYEECLNQAPPGDTEALTRCAELLR